MHAVGSTKKVVTDKYFSLHKCLLPRAPLKKNLEDMWVYGTHMHARTHACMHTRMHVRIEPACVNQ